MLLPRLRSWLQITTTAIKGDAMKKLKYVSLQDARNEQEEGYRERWAFEIADHTVVALLEYKELNSGTSLAINRYTKKNAGMGGEYWFASVEGFNMGFEQAMTMLSSIISELAT